MLILCLFTLSLLYLNQNYSHVSVDLFSIYLHAYVQTKRNKKMVPIQRALWDFFSVIDFGKNFVGMQKLLQSTHKIILRIYTLIKIKTMLKLFIHFIPWKNETYNSSLAWNFICNSNAAISTNHKKNFLNEDDFCYWVCNFRQKPSLLWHNVESQVLMHFTN